MPISPQTLTRSEHKLAARFLHLPSPLQSSIQVARQQQAATLREVRQRTRRFKALIRKRLGCLTKAEARLTRHAATPGVKPARLLQLARLRESLAARQHDLTAQQPMFAKAMQSHQQQLDTLEHQASLCAAEVLGQQLYLTFRQEFLAELRQCATGTHPLKHSIPSCIDRVDDWITNAKAYTAFHGEDARQRDFDGYTPDYLEYRNHVVTGFVTAFTADSELNGLVLILKEETSRNTEFHRSAWVATGETLAPVKIIDLHLAAPPLRQAA